MGKRQPADQISPRRLRIGSLAIAGALPLVAALANTGTAAAAPVTTEDNQSTVVENQPGPDTQPGLVLDSPFGQLSVPVPPMAADGLRGETAPIAAESDPAAEAAPVIDTADTTSDSVEPVVAAPAPVVRVGRNSATGVRDIPRGPVAAVDVQGLHMPDPSQAADVAPIAAPEGMLRFGDTQIGIPTFLTPEQAAQVNEVSAGVEANLARTLDSAGFEPSRSDRIAASTVGTAAVGAAVGVGVAAPVEVAGAVLGGFVGAMAGTPFAPAGWVVGPTIGATAAATIIAVPAATIGAGIGAAVGAVNGVLAPATGPAASIDEPAVGTSDAGAAIAE
ncbi:hypothetical protein OHB26_33035 [Nocardia sp. NBC_01503]|uniref:hypothetical protein n=1 Tax=Nocardia sp. NBC_01503 TaxID=2975997 RepID=UPI002E7B79A3|nr:hypothetical protein [Nocardia sp. NBC_01503]WTL31681.1 hypothetical protein OHB26_33035 [Nocardia sp. NBC_01503]